MALILLGSGVVNFAEGRAYETPPLSVKPDEEQLFSVELVTEPFERRYEYVVVVPVFNTFGGLFRGVEVGRYYLGPMPMLLNVPIPGKELGKEPEVSLLLLPQSIYRRQASIIDLEIEVRYSDGKEIKPLP